MERRIEANSPGAEIALVKVLDGTRVRIGGYVVPLDIGAETVNEFLLIPYVGACVHVPAPPPNQVIHVTTALDLSFAAPFAPVIVTGTIRAALISTNLADAGYSLRADAVKAHRPYQD